MQEAQVQSLDREDALEKEMATPSSILAWEIQGQRSLAGYSLWGHKRVRQDSATKQQQQSWEYQYTHQQREIDSNTVIVGNFNVPLTPVDGSSRQKISKEIPTLIK